MRRFFLSGLPTGTDKGSSLVADTTLEVALTRGRYFPMDSERDANVCKAKALMGIRIVNILDEAGLSVRQAEIRTGISHVEFSRIRQAKLRRFTLDRLMTILESLGQDVEVSVTVHARDLRMAAPAE